MPTPQLRSLNPDATLAELKDYLIGLNRYLNHLLSSLDTLNISRLDAKVIIAQTITAVQIAAGTITADKMDVTELSAIAANLGTIIAGIINAVTINGATINISDDVRIGKYLYLNATSSSGEEKGVIFEDDGTEVGKISSLSGDVSIHASSDLLLSGGGSADVYANGGKVAVQGIGVTISVMGGDGITPMDLHFIGGTLRTVV